MLRKSVLFSLALLLVFAGASHALTAAESITRFQANEVRINTFVNEEGYYTTTGGSRVETLPSLVTRKDAEISQRYVLNMTGDWVTSTEYVVNDLVISDSVVYLCVDDHESGTFSTDLAAGKWITYQGQMPYELHVDTEAGLIAAIGNAGIKTVRLTEDIELKADLEVTAGKIYAPTPGSVVTTYYSIRSADYRWILTGSGTAEYKCELAAGTDPGFSKPSALWINGAAAVEGTAGALNSGEWDYSGGYVIVRTGADSDPDSEALGYVEVHYTLTFASGSHLVDNGGQMFDAAAGEVTGLRYALPGGRVPPEMFGAIGGDSNDDTAAFNCANDSLASSGAGGVIVLKPVTYRLRDFRLSTRVDLIGAQREDTILQFHPSGDDAADSLLYTVYSTGSYSHISNLTISGGNAVGNGLYLDSDSNGQKRRVSHVIVRNFGGYNAAPAGGTYGVAANYAAADITDGAGAHLLIGGKGIKCDSGWELDIDNVQILSCDGDGIDIGSVSDSRLNQMDIGKCVNRGLVLEEGNKNIHLSNIKIYMCRMLNVAQSPPTTYALIVPHEDTLANDTGAVVLTGSHIQAVNIEAQENGSFGFMLGTSARGLYDSNLSITADGNGGYDPSQDAPTQAAYRRYGVVLHNYHALNLTMVGQDFRSKNNYPRQSRGLHILSKPTFTTNGVLVNAERYRIADNTGSDFTPLQLGLGSTSNAVGFVFQAKQAGTAGLATATFGTGYLEAVNDGLNLTASIENNYEQDQGTGNGYSVSSDGGNSRIVVNGVVVPKTTTYTTIADHDESDATVSSVGGLTPTVYVGQKYEFVAKLNITADATGGYKLMMGGTCTATSIYYTINVISSDANVLSSVETALGSGASKASETTVYAEMRGTIVVATTGTLSVQFAQHTANGTSTVVTGSTLELTQVAN